LQSFDPANPSQPHHKREVTTTPLQALTLFNSDIVFGWSQALAGRVIREAGNDESAQLNRLYQVLFSRDPNKAEKLALKEFLNTDEKAIQRKASNGKFEVAIPTGLNEAQQANPIRALRSSIWFTRSRTRTTSPTGSEPGTLHDTSRSSKKENTIMSTYSSRRDFCLRPARAWAARVERPDPRHRRGRCRERGRVGRSARVQANALPGQGQSVIWLHMNGAPSTLDSTTTSPIW